MLLLLRRRTTNHVIPRQLRNYTLWLTILHCHHRNDVTFFRLLALTRGLLVAEKCVLLFCVVVVVPVVVHGVCKGLIIDPLVYFVVSSSFIRHPTDCVEIECIVSLHSMFMEVGAAYLTWIFFIVDSPDTIPIRGKPLSIAPITVDGQGVWTFSKTCPSFSLRERALFKIK